MDGQIDPPVQQILLDLFRKNTLEARLGPNLRQRDILNLVARRLDNLDTSLAAQLLKPCGDPVRLPEGQLRPARADDRVLSTAPASAG